MFTSKLEFDHAAARLAGRMIAASFSNSEDAITAANEVENFVASLPKFLTNCPSCKREIAALRVMKNNVLSK